MKRRRRPRIPPSVLEHALHAPCDFPRCACGEKADRMVDALNRNPAPTADDIDVAREALICLLHCAAAHAIDPRMRRHAVLQLCHPVFAGARAWWN